MRTWRKRIRRLTAETILKQQTTPIAAVIRNSPKDLKSIHRRRLWQVSEPTRYILPIKSSSIRGGEPAAKAQLWMLMASCRECNRPKHLWSTRPSSTKVMIKTCKMPNMGLPPILRSPLQWPTWVKLNRIILLVIIIIVVQAKYLFPNLPNLQRGSKGTSREEGTPCINTITAFRQTHSNSMDNNNNNQWPLPIMSKTSTCL